jgi:hypothetical protein
MKTVAWKIIYYPITWKNNMGICVIKIGYSECQLRRAIAVAKSKCGEVGADIPQCEKDGNYSPVQCSGSTGICCCANPKTGVKEPSSCLKAPKKPFCSPKGKQFIIV